MPKLSKKKAAARAAHQKNDAERAVLVPYTRISQEAAKTVLPALERITDRYKGNRTKALIAAILAHDEEISKGKNK